MLVVGKPEVRVGTPDKQEVISLQDYGIPRDTALLISSVGDR